MIQRTKHYSNPCQYVDLHHLYDGINVNVKGEKVHVKAILELVLRDNLSAHAIAGFQSHFNSGSICRYCTVKYNKFREINTVSELVERTDAIYADQIKYIDQKMQLFMASNTDVYFPSFSTFLWLMLFLLMSCMTAQKE